MPIKIVTDSTSDLPADVARELNISIIPAYINIGAQSYLDGDGLSRSEFYARLGEYPTPPTTSAPGPEAFSAVYRQAAAQGFDAVVSIHVSSTWSSIYNTARLGAEALQSIKVTVVDSRTVSMGLGLLAQAAGQAAQAGRSVGEIVSLLGEKARRTHVFALLDTLEFLRRSGRASRIQSSLGSLLRIKPLLRVHDGDLHMERLHTNHSALERIACLARDLAPLEAVALMHTVAGERLARLRERVHHLFPAGPPAYTVEATPLIGTHIGPGAIGMALIAAG